MLAYCIVLFFLASATVVPTLTSLISVVHETDKGAVAGVFRSIGALARALGPIFASTSESQLYWYPQFGARAGDSKVGPKKRSGPSNWIGQTIILPQDRSSLINRMTFTFYLYHVVARVETEELPQFSHALKVHVGHAYLI